MTQQILIIEDESSLAAIALRRDGRWPGQSVRAFIGGGRKTLGATQEPVEGE